jgi:hypothetical protein
MKGNGSDIFQDTTPGIHLQGLRKTAKRINQDSRCPGWDPIQRLHEYKSEALLLG